MQMALRWFGGKFDTVPLKYIRQIPGVKGVITTLYDARPGDDWDGGAIKSLRKEVEDSGLKILGIESVNVSDDIKTGGPRRDEHIQNYINTLEKLADEGIGLVCYNFMAVFDWTRSDLAKVLADGSATFAYDQAVIDAVDPERMFDAMDSLSGGFPLPGWEPERMARVKELFGLYKDVTEEKLFQNLLYFLKAILPTCNKRDLKMAIHMDDPAWSVFGLPRIMTTKKKVLRLMEALPDPRNGVTLCTGSLGSNPENDIPDIIRSLKGRVHFAHVRNLRHIAPGVFEETAHYSADGSLDMYEIMKALTDIDFDGPIRPDHGRMIWDETAMPGYGLYDRALGVQYLLGLREAILRGRA